MIEDLWKICNSDALSAMGALDDCSVNCCVTSPPYWGLRDYGTAKWEGGDPECGHLGKPMSVRAGFNERYFGRESTEGNKQDALREPFTSSCGKCGATRIDFQLGLEATPEEYVSKLVEVFREVRRVLRDDGTLWLNLGDTYAGSGAGGASPETSTLQGGLDSQNASKGGIHRARPSYRRDKESVPNGRSAPSGLKTKDLVGIPWRVAFALQADGWYLRQDIIWHKPNPMPESVTDRCTKAHEYIFLLAKSKTYYYDHEAIKEPAACAGQSRGGSTNRYEQNEFGADSKVYNDRNKRSVWTVNPAAFKEAHFATFPPDLIEPCIMAGCPEGGLVMDPFTGSGTTGLVALKHGCRFWGSELNPDYAKMASNRIGNYASQSVMDFAK